MTKVADKLKEKLEGEEEEEVGEEECEEDEEEEDCEDEEAEEEYEEEDEEAEEEEYEEEEYEEEEEEEEYEEEAEDCEDKESAVVLPKGWIQQYSNQYNCPLYCNTKTGETQWHAPGTIPPKTSGAVQRDPYQAQHSFRGTGNKKALLVGINYEGTDSELSGCINDAINLKQFIVENYGYNPSPQTMLMLTDDATDRKKQPTLKNLLAGFYWLVSNTKPGDELFFSYSGHGGQIEDDDGDRSSGLDCTLCPADYDTAGQIRSDDVHKYLVAALPEGVKLTVIMDCCHSGTMMELPYTYRPDANGKMSPVDLVKKGITIVSGAQKLLQGGFSMSKINDAKKLFEEAKGLAAAFNSGKETTQGGYKEEAFNENSAAPKMVFCLSGCRDEQTSADATFDGKASGALTYAILKSLEANRNLSYEELLLQLRGFMKGEFSQIPQLSCGVPVDPKSPFSF
ncbi:caspase domain-containing protein [Obelidium mucronatum]|nr:caspase domain-containing protein [Obelidium mucronatum]